MLTIPELIQHIKTDPYLSKAIDVKYRKETETLAVFGKPDLSPFLTTKLTDEKLDPVFTGAVPQSVSANHLRKLFDYLNEYEGTPESLRYEKKPIEFCGMYLTNLIASQNHWWQSGCGGPDTLSFGLTTQPERGFQFTKDQRDQYDEVLAGILSGCNVRVEISGER